MLQMLGRKTNPTENLTTRFAGDGDVEVNRAGRSVLMAYFLAG
jgi:hypothetical protein